MPRAVPMRTFREPPSEARSGLTPMITEGVTDARWAFCGFGGIFSVFGEVVSSKMDYYKLSDHARAGTVNIAQILNRGSA
jgi:hypothetical protein